MDFVAGLSLSQGKTIILVVIDHLSKQAHFLHFSHPDITTSVARLFFDNIFKLHGLPKSIICDQDPTFTRDF